MDRKVQEELFCLSAESPLFLEHEVDGRHAYLSGSEVHAVQLGDQILLDLASFRQHLVGHGDRSRLVWDVEDLEYKALLVNVVGYVVTAEVL